MLRLMSLPLHDRLRGATRDLVSRYAFSNGKRYRPSHLSIIYNLCFYGIAVKEYLAGEVDLLVVELMKVIVSIVMFKADVLTNVSRPRRF